MMENLVDAYLKAQPEPHRTTLQTVRERIAAVIPEAEECISYAIPGFRVRGKMVAGIAGFTNHLSYFPHSGQVFTKVADHLTGYDWAVGTLRFPIDTPLPLELIEILIAERMRQAFA